VLLNAKQTLNFDGDAPGWQSEPGKINVDLPTLAELPNLTAELAKLSEVLGGHH
jgi:hypothetical protein